MDLKGSYVCLCVCVCVCVCVCDRNKQARGKRKKKTRKREDGGRFIVWFALVTVWQAKVCVCVCVCVHGCDVCANTACLCNLQSDAGEINEMSSCSIQSCSSTPPPVWIGDWALSPSQLWLKATVADMPRKVIVLINCPLPPSLMECSLKIKCRAVRPAVPTSTAARTSSSWKCYLKGTVIGFDLFAGIRWGNESVDASYEGLKF